MLQVKDFVDEAKLLRLRFVWLQCLLNAVVAYQGIIRGFVKMKSLKEFVWRMRMLHFAALESSCNKCGANVSSVLRIELLYVDHKVTFLWNIYM